MGLAIGLGLIAIGSGGIKPCVSAHVGDQFGRTNAHLLTKVFGWFYFAINVGALASILFAEPLLHRFGPSVAFGVPGVLMAIATLVFWSGRYKFARMTGRDPASVVNDGTINADGGYARRRARLREMPKQVEKLLARAGEEAYGAPSVLVALASRRRRCPTTSS